MASWGHTETWTILPGQGETTELSFSSTLRAKKRLVCCKIESRHAKLRILPQEGERGEQEYPRRRQWQPTPVLLPGKSHGRRSLVGCSPWVAKSQTPLCKFTFTFHFYAWEKEVATHSSVLALRIPGTGEPGGLPTVGSHRIRHDWSDLAIAVAVAIYYIFVLILIFEYILPFWFKYCIGLLMVSVF